MSLMWALGLSHRSVRCALTALGCPAYRMSGWRAVQEAGKAAARGMSKRATGRTPVIGANEAIAKARGKVKLVGFMADAASGRLLGIDMLVEWDSYGFANRLKGYVERLGAKAVVTDDLSTLRGYKSIAGMMNGLWLTQRVWGESDMDMGDMLTA